MRRPSRKTSIIEILQLIIKYNEIVVCIVLPIMKSEYKPCLHQLVGWKMWCQEGMIVILFLLKLGGKSKNRSK